MDNTAQLDADGDGLPDHDTRRNTYDALGLLRHAVLHRQPVAVGAAGGGRGSPTTWATATQAARVARDARRGPLPSFDRKLWNGEYYSLWVDGNERDECCMTDQIDGEWFTELIGLGHTLPADRIRAALRAIMQVQLQRRGRPASTPATRRARKPTLCDVPEPPGRRRRGRASSTRSRR